MAVAQTLRSQSKSAKHSETIFDRVKNIPNKHKLLVSGFIRNCERELFELCSDDIFYSIPELVTVTCLLFYHIADVFQDISDDLIKSGMDNNTITKDKAAKNGWKCCAYGSYWIDSMSKDIYSWNFDIIRNPDDGNMAVGFVSNLHHQQVNRDWEADQAYLFGTNGWISMHTEYDNKRHGKFKIKEGDTLTLVLNMDKGHIEGYKNGNEREKSLLCHTVIKQEDLKYRLALSIFRENDCIKVSRN